MTDTTAMDTELLQELRKHMGHDAVNSHLANVSRAKFAGGAAAALHGSPGAVRTMHEHVSRVLFGNSKRLDAGLWVAQLADEDADEFWAAQYGDWCRLNTRPYPGDIGAELRRFAILGMLELVKVDRANIYRRLPSPLWDVFIMLDVVLAEAVGERRFYQPSVGRVQMMVQDLMQIRSDTAPVPFSIPPEDPEAVRRQKMVEAAARARLRPRGPNGEYKCSRCKKWLMPDQFSLRPSRGTAYPKSWCKTCMAARQRQRYMSLEKIEALNMVGVTFKVGETDDVVGVSCASCGELIQAGDSVHADARLVHESCMT